MSLVATLAQEFRVNSPNFDRFELRMTSAGMFDTFMRQTRSNQSFITPELEERALNSMGNTVKIPVINYKDVTIRNTRPIVIPADENTSTFYTVVFTTLAYGFKMYPAQHGNNNISYQRDFNKKFEAMIVKMKKKLEELAVTAVDAAKTQVIAEVTGGHTWAGNVVSENAASLKDSYIIHDLESMFNSNDLDLFGGDVVGNQGLKAITTRMEGFGTYNEENKTLPFASKNWHFSNSIPNGTGKAATGYAIADGTLGMLQRLEWDSLNNSRYAGNYEFGTVDLPMLGVTAGTYYYEEVIDASGLHGGTGHLTRTGAECMDFAYDVAFVVAHNSDRSAIPSGITKFDVATA